VSCKGRAGSQPKADAPPAQSPALGTDKLAKFISFFCFHVTLRLLRIVFLSLNVSHKKKNKRKAAAKSAKRLPLN